MPVDLDADPGQAIGLCRVAHARLMATVADVTDEQVRSPSRLPGWTIGHVLTHLARNADGHSRRLDGALRGADVPRYPGGPAQRNSDIDAGAPRPAAEIIADLVTSQDRLELAWERSAAADWPHPELRGDDHWPTTASPARRLPEAEMHDVDLGLGYEPSNWPDDYVAWELPRLLATVPSRLQRSTDARLGGAAVRPGAGPSSDPARSMVTAGQGPHRPGDSALARSAGNPGLDTVPQQLSPHDGHTGAQCRRYARLVEPGGVML